MILKLFFTNYPKGTIFNSVLSKAEQLILFKIHLTISKKDRFCLNFHNFLFDFSQFKFFDTMLLPNCKKRNLE